MKTMIRKDIKVNKVINGKSRSMVQIFFFLMVALIGISLHSMCPFGGVVSLYQFLSTGTIVKKVHEASFVMMGLIFLLSLGFGAVFCGWICPLGTFQEWIGKIGKKILGKRHNHLIPQRIDNIMRYMRYVVLAAIIYVTAKTGVLAFSDKCPYHALFNFWKGNVVSGGIIILGTIALLSLLVERPWCKYACPYGAILGIFNRFRLFKLVRKEDNCISCKLCDKSCPMNIKVSDKSIISDHQCIGCLECSSDNACPVSSTVGFTLPFTGGYFKSWMIGIISLTVIFGGIGLSKSLDLWKTTNGKEPAMIRGGVYDGAYNPADIRGSFTLGRTSEYFNIPIEHLTQAFGIPLDLAYSLRHGDLESKVYPELEERGTEIGNGSVKLFVALYTGLPYEVTEPTYLLKQAVDILKEFGRMDEEQMKYVEAHMIDLSR